MSLAGRITEAWQHKSVCLWLFAPLTLLYALVTGLRRYAYRRGWLRRHDFRVPVIVVGNLTVGGTGKSPLVAALAQALENMGYRPGVVSRGYGAKDPHQSPVRVSSESSPAEVGDEPAMLAQIVDCPIVVCRDRVQAVAALVELGCDVVISDDGMQHYRMGRSLEICVVDGARGWGNGWLLPMGPLREPLSRLHQVSCLVLNGTEQIGFSGNAPVFSMTLTPQSLVPLHAESATLHPESGTRVHAVAGIGNPGRFFATLRSMGYQVTEHAFADHHVYTQNDFKFDCPLPIVMTAKDAIKCRNLSLLDAWVLPVEAALSDDFCRFVNTKLNGSVKTGQLNEN
ncbi:MAG: tetraacyldisaccharide 4'-kinase [Oleiphilaceae bacterium]|nr:tetraacyldisaccharide 4'-kinase [Oleiphilaceae bacterium]